MKTPSGLTKSQITIEVLINNENKILDVMTIITPDNIPIKVAEDIIKSLSDSLYNQDLLE